MAIEYKTINDLNAAIVRNIGEVPSSIDLVVGVPRSGMLAASALALHLNAGLVDLNGFLDGRRWQEGGRRVGAAPCRQDSGRRVLVVDDSVQSGQEMKRVRALVEKSGRGEEVQAYAAVFGSPEGARHVDLCFEVISGHRVFEWNVLDCWILRRSCVDIDGVLCYDPTEAENDDGAIYRKFLTGAEPLCLPRNEIGWVVTSRLERYRKETEEWLSRHNIRYRELWMLDLPSKAERQRLRAHVPFKVDAYKRSGAQLFIESSARQARGIAVGANAPVFCVETRTMEWPPAWKRTWRQKVPAPIRHVYRSTRSVANQLLGRMGERQG